MEIRELLIDHVGHRCCWGSRPARTWRIHAVEDCNVYVGTLDTFIEEREIIRETEPYLGGSIDGKDNGPDKQELALQQVTMYSTSRFTYGQNIFCNKRKQENVATLNLSLH